MLNVEYVKHRGSVVSQRGRRRVVQEGAHATQDEQIPGGSRQSCSPQGRHTARALGQLADPLVDDSAAPTQTPTLSTPKLDRYPNIIQKGLEILDQV